MEPKSAELVSAHWWEPHNPARKLAGVLVKGEDDSWSLHLDGTFKDLPRPTEPGQQIGVPLELPDPFPVLVGVTTSGRLISLLDCHVLRGTLPIISRGALEVRPSLIAYDIHFASGEDFKLRTLSVHCSNLDAWIGISGFSVNFAPHLYPVSINYCTPSSIEVPLDSGMTVGFSFTGSGPTLPVLTEVRIVQQSWIKVRANEPRLFDDLWQMFVELTNLIVLAIGQPVRPLKLGATCDVVNSPDGKPYPVELIDNRRQAVVSSHEVASYDMLFTFADIQQRFQDIVKAWFGRDEKIRSLYDLYFGTLRSGSMYVEHRFLNMFQALESFDRRSFTHSPEKQKKHQERLTQILGCVAEVYKKWLKNKLEHSHEPSAADRIRRLVKDLGADWVLGESDITLAGDIRNYYTHFDSKLEQRLPPMAERVRAMYNLSIRLQLLCELLLLRAAGLMPDEMKRRMQETRRLERRLLK